MDLMYACLCRKANDSTVAFCLSTCIIILSNPMSKLQPPSPLQKLHLSSTLTQNQPDLHHSKIHDLYSKFQSISNQVSLDYDLSAFNLIQYNHRELKMDFDQQMIVAKLKRLENNAELKRINMELENRKRKNYRTKVKEYHILPEKEKYMNTYREFTELKSSQLKENEVHSDSEEENHVEVERPRGITFFTELKRHPKVLQYTVQQVRSRQRQKREVVDSKQLKREEFKSQIKRTIVTPAIKSSRYASITQKDKESNPEQIAQNIFRKLYTKRNKERSIDEIKQDQRMSHFVERQELIIDHIDEHSLSKQLHKKLKERMNDIATELYLQQKKHQTLSAFPKVRATPRTRPNMIHPSY